MSGAACTEARRWECPLQFDRRSGKRIFCGRSWNGTGKNCSGSDPVGLRTIAKLAAGSDQRGFKTAPIQLVIAVSDKGKIKRLGGWKEPSEPFRVFVTKADLVPDKIGQELKQHKKSASILNAESAGEYGRWSMKALEVEQVAEFLAARHVDRSGAPPARSKRTASNRSRRSSRDKAARHRTLGESGMQALRFKRPHRAIGQVRLLLAVRHVQKEHGDACGVPWMWS